MSALMVLGILAAGFVTQGVVPDFIHQSWPSPEASLVLGRRVVGIALLAGAAHARGYRAGICFLTGLLVLAVSDRLATIHQWNQAAAVGSAVGWLVLAVYVIWLLSRPARRRLRLESAEAAILREPYLPPPVALPGEATEIYPRRGKVVRGLAIQLVALLALAGAVGLVALQEMATPRDRRWPAARRRA
jgi:hypothetical protein